MTVQYFKQVLFIYSIKHLNYRTVIEMGQPSLSLFLNKYFSQTAFHQQ